MQLQRTLLSLTTAAHVFSINSIFLFSLLPLAEKTRQDKEARGTFNDFLYWGVVLHVHTLEKSCALQLIETFWKVSTSNIFLHHGSSKNNEIFPRSLRDFQHFSMVKFWTRIFPTLFFSNIYFQHIFDMYASFPATQNISIKLRTYSHHFKSIDFSSDTIFYRLFITHLFNVLYDFSFQKSKLKSLL